MMLVMLLQIAAPATAIEAERAMAHAAKMEGAVAALRRYAAPDAVVFLARPTGVDGLTDSAEPVLGGTRRPTTSVMSCDGSWVLNFGLVTYPDGSMGNFHTLWARAADGRWQWKVSEGSRLPELVAVPAPTTQLDVSRAACPTAVPAAPFPIDDAPAARSGIGRSRDGTLAYQWSWTANTHHWRVGKWNSVAWDIVLWHLGAERVRP